MTPTDWLIVVAIITALIVVLYLDIKLKKPEKQTRDKVVAFHRKGTPECETMWLGSLGRSGHTHKCLAGKDHVIDHVCSCGEVISKENLHEPENY